MSNRNELVRVRVGGTSKNEYKVLEIVAGKPAYTGGPHVVKWTASIPTDLPEININSIEMTEDYVGVCKLYTNGKWDGVYRLCLNANPSVKHLLFVGSTLPYSETIQIPTTEDPEVMQSFLVPYGA